MKNLIAIRTIDSIPGYEDYNRWGSDCYHGCSTKKVEGDIVHVHQVIQPGGVKEEKFIDQEVHSDGTIHSIVLPTYTINEEEGDLMLENDYLHDNIFDVFIGAKVPVTVEKKKRFRVGKGFVVKKIPVESIENGYWYGKYRVVDTWVDKKTGFHHFIQKPVSLTA